VLTPADVAHYRAAGADVVLIGEALVTGDPVATLNAFLEAGAVPAPSGRHSSGRTPASPDGEPR
jgi:indole-3-glycerol phosphate synthase